MHNARSNWAWIDRVQAETGEGIGPVSAILQRSGAKMWGTSGTDEVIKTVMLVAGLVGFALGLGFTPALDRLDGRTCLTAQPIERLK